MYQIMFSDVSAIEKYILTLIKTTIGLFTYNVPQEMKCVFINMIY